LDEPGLASEIGWSAQYILPVCQEPVLLVDDTVNSRRTLSEAGMTLRDASSGAIYPFALLKYMVVDFQCVDVVRDESLTHHSYLTVLNKIP